MEFLREAFSGSNRFVLRLAIIAVLAPPSAAATAWFDPLPPSVTSAVLPMIVSPGRSTFWNTLPLPCRSSRPGSRWVTKRSMYMPPPPCRMLARPLIRTNE